MRGFRTSLPLHLDIIPSERRVGLPSAYPHLSLNCDQISCGKSSSSNQATHGPSNTFAIPGDTYFITYDNSYNDHSQHHYGNAYVTKNYNTGPMGLNLNQARDLLLQHVSHGALHNSAQHGPDAPKCFPETRVAVQQEIISWIKHGDQDTNPKRILWLSGPAGSGKTSIAGSIANECCKTGLLGASFFFSSSTGSPDRRSKMPLIATLVYQLIQQDSILGLRDEVLAVVGRNPLIFRMNLRAQMDALILNPLRKVFARSNPQTWPRLILIDGLGECGRVPDGDALAQDERVCRDNDHREILSILVCASKHPSFPFRIMITSRPEQAIRRYFSSQLEGTSKKVFLNSKYKPEADIELFLRAMLVKIGRDQGLPADWYQQTLPPDWPKHRTNNIPRFLAKEASDQFIYAATAIRFVQDGTDTPHEQLKRILTWRSPNTTNPFASLDALYARILRTSAKPLVSAKWLVAISVMKPYFRTARFVKAILETSAGETEIVLGSLTSLISLVRDDGKPKFAFCHKSLVDFLQDPERSGELCIRADSVVVPFLSERCYQLMKNRGPQVPLPPCFSEAFLEALCSRYSVFFAHRFQYDANDVEWYTPRFNIDYNRHVTELLSMFSRVHEECRWYGCLPACEVWRKGITQFFEAKGWGVPTWMEMLQDRFQTFDGRYYRSHPLFKRPLELTAEGHR